ncbi:MAG: methylenetetrahydrofolate reductase [Pseudomonadota bacterium]
MALPRPVPLSFELFPPRQQAEMARIAETISPLRSLDPDFISVTYGAGGSSRGRTLDALARLTRERGPVLAGHLTCAGCPRDVTLAVAERYADMGVSEIIALRGDPPETDERPGDEFADAVDLVAALSDMGKFTVRVACYPEVHPLAQSPEADIDVLKAKFDAGADTAITQFFFDIDAYDRFMERCARAGIAERIIPGIMPIQSFCGIARFARHCGTSIPVWLRDAFAHVETKEQHDLLSLSICTELADDLIARGAPGLHFYTLNKPDLAVATCRALGLRQMAEPVQASGLKAAV